MSNLHLLVVMHRQVAKNIVIFVYNFNKIPVINTFLITVLIVKTCCANCLKNNINFDKLRFLATFCTMRKNIIRQGGDNESNIIFVGYLHPNVEIIHFLY